MPLHSAWLLDNGQSRQDTRVSPTGTFTPTSPMATRSGVVPGSTDGTSRISGFTVVGVTAMTAQVYPGRAVIQGLDAQGAYAVSLTENLTLAFEDGDAQYGRIDLVVLRVHDDQFDASGRNDATVEIIKGTPAATPVAPAAPAQAIALYQVQVPVNASASNGIQWDTALTGVRNATVAAGGILPVSTDTAPGAYPGQFRDVAESSATGHLERWNGHAWARYPAYPDPVWRNWTPAWTTSSGLHLPSFGNASLTCRYVQHGPTVHFTFQIGFGTTTAFGTGAGTSDNWLFSLPVPAAGVQACMGFAELYPNDVKQRAVARLRCASTTQFELEISATMPGVTAPVTGLTDSVSPWVWASGHSLSGSGTYEAAV